LRGSDEAGRLVLRPGFAQIFPGDRRAACNRVSPEEAGVGDA